VTIATKTREYTMRPRSGALDHGALWLSTSRLPAGVVVQESLLLCCKTSTMVLAPIRWHVLVGSKMMCS